ncbi:MAG: hypothetical protein H6935_05990 [Thiobacillus sp.]|nr:hypothetical protein [Thiobacillus sp.]
MLKKFFYSALMLVPALPAWSADLSLNLYGLSHHWERDRAQALNVDNEFNPGLGLRYALAPAKICKTPFTEAAFYRDSGRNTAVYAALGCLGLELARGLRLGGALTAFQSDSYNSGDPFVAPLPLLSWERDTVTLNLIHFPKVKGFNDINTTGLYVSLGLN